MIGKVTDLNWEFFSFIDNSTFAESFLPFVQSENKLPMCKFRLFKKAESTEVVADSVFLRYICKRLPVGAKLINGYSFSLCGDGVAVREANGFAAWVHNNFREIDICILGKNMDSPVLRQVVMRAFSYTAVFQGALIMHAAATVYNNESILFCGVPGAGKSTQSRLWESVYGSVPLNNDQPCIFWEENKAMAHGTPWSGKEPCYKNEYYPIKAIVFVEKAPGERIERLSVAEAYALIHLNNFLPPLVYGAEEKYSEVVERLVTTVPVYRQYCTKTEDAPRELHKMLYAEK